VTQIRQDSSQAANDFQKPMAPGLTWPIREALYAAMEPKPQNKAESK